MPSVVVFDCESDGRPNQIGTRGEQDFRLVQCTCACAMVISTDRICLPEASKDLLVDAEHLTCWRDRIAHKGANPFAKLFRAFDRAEVIVGFNALEFDFPLLYKYYGVNGHGRYVRHRLKCLDIFSRIRAATNRWPGLGDLLSANGLPGKTGDGAEAIRLWNDQKRDELEAYCVADVRLTAELALLPRIRMGDVWIPGHVYGVGPAVQACFVAKAMTSTTTLPAPPESPDTLPFDGEAAALQPTPASDLDWCLVLGEQKQT